MAKCCILGGGGFIGLNLARRLAGAGRDVRTFGHPSAFPEALPAGDHRIGAFDDSAAAAAAVEGCDVVYHLIGPINLAETERAAAAQTRLAQQTLHLMDLARRGAFGRLVFLSSGGTVYGVTPACPVAEDAPQWPISSYGAGKLTIERRLHVHHHLYGTDYRIARVSNPFGPYQRTETGQGVVAALIAHGLAGTRFPLMGDGAAVRDYVAVGDVADALERLGRHDGPGRVFNIGSGVGRSLLQMIALTEEAVGRRIAVDRQPGRPLDVPVNILDIGRARRELGWAPATPVEAALRTTVDWFRQRGRTPAGGTAIAGAAG